MQLETGFSNFNTHDYFVEFVSFLIYLVQKYPIYILNI